MLWLCISSKNWRDGTGHESHYTLVVTSNDRLSIQRLNSTPIIVGNIALMNIIKCCFLSVPTSLLIIKPYRALLVTSNCTVHRNDSLCTLVHSFCISRKGTPKFAYFLYSPLELPCLYNCSSPCKSIRIYLVSEACILTLLMKLQKCCL